MYEYKLKDINPIKSLLGCIIYGSGMAWILFDLSKGRIEFGVNYAIWMYLIWNVLRKGMINVLKSSPKYLNIILTGYYLLNIYVFSLENLIGTAVLSAINILGVVTIYFYELSRVFKHKDDKIVIGITDAGMGIKDIFSNDKVYIKREDIEIINEDMFDSDGIMVHLKKESWEKYRDYSRFKMGKIKINTGYIKDNRDDIMSLMKKILTTRITLHNKSVIGG